MDVTPTTGTLIISAHIIDHFQKLQSFRKWDKRLDINPKDKTSYTIEYQEAFPNYLAN